MKRALFACLLVAVFAAPAVAQDPVMALNPTTMVGYSGTIAADQYARRAFGEHVKERRAAPSSVAPANPARFAYRPSAAVRQQVYGRAIARAQKASPTEAPKLRAALASGRVANETASYLRRYGMSPTNLADTTALYLAMSWFATRASASDPTPAQMSGLRNQVAATFASMPTLMHASDAAKQELSEANIIEASFSSNIANAAARDPAFAPKARSAVAQNVMNTYGLDLRKLTLTAQGLR